tara:strand:- start:440 stop:712 length:273 start_codon:yes stop_codon:yes gene_type:complete
MSELGPWRKIIMTKDATDEELKSFIKSRYKELSENVDKYGFWEFIDKINLNDYPDNEFHKLVKYYEQHKSLLKNYIKIKAGDGKDRRTKG